MWLRETDICLRLGLFLLDYVVVRAFSDNMFQWGNQIDLDLGYHPH